jgi:hypothetical protein
MDRLMTLVYDELRAVAHRQKPLALIPGTYSWAVDRV